MPGCALRDVVQRSVKAAVCKRGAAGRRGYSARLSGASALWLGALARRRAGDVDLRRQSSGSTESAALRSG